MIPTGNITFLFTDIEGSTKLSQEFPESLLFSLERHNEILRTAVETNNGFVFKIIGDAFCCAFKNAVDAVKAAVEVQFSLANENWEEAVIKVRMGIHSGNAEWNGNDYIGYITLARATRVMSAAYGEQILISKDTHLHYFESSAGGIEAKEVSFRDLGERRLKDVIQPIRLFQVLAKGLREEFPPLKTLDARPNNLPVQLTSFIGREKPIRDLKRLLSKTHLLTVIGAGGSGKTRLAMQAAADMIDEFGNGVFIAELAPVSDPALIMQKIMTSIGIKEETGVSPFDSMISYLRDKELLLIMDNCEHLIYECAEVAENLLMNCSKLKIIATSREALNCSGEQTYKIPMLTLPDSSEVRDQKDLYKYESSFLFLERLYSANPDFHINEKSTKAIIDICRHLDGIPLAIELAAAGSKYLSVENIRSRLDDRFKILTAGKRTALPKHQTLKALIDWSYELLNDKERLLWKRISVFNGGWDLEKAEEICSDEKISSNEILELHGCLIEKSIINFNVKTERYSILETLKKYGEDKLREDNQLSDMLNKHLTCFKNYSETAEKKLFGSDIYIWLDKLEADHLNFQSAIEWSVNGGDKENGAGLTVSLWRFWDIRGYYSTGIKYIYYILKNENEISRPLSAKLYLHAAQLARFRGEYDRSREYFNQSLKICSEPPEDKLMIASSYNGLGNIEFELDNYEDAKIYYEKALALRREAGDRISISKSLNNLGNLAFRRDELEEGKKYYTESIELAKELGDNKAIASSLHNLSNLTFETGDFEKGKRYSEESLLLRREMGDKLGMAESLFNLGRAYFIEKIYDTSLKFFEESLKLYREIEDTDDIAKTLIRIGEIESIMGNFVKAGNLISESIKLSEIINNKTILAESIFEAGKISFANNNKIESSKFFKEFIEMRSELKDLNNIAKALIYLLGIQESGSYQLSHVQVLAAAEYAIIVMGTDLQEEEIKIKEIIKSSLIKKFGRKKFDEFSEKGKMLILDEACQLIVDN